MSALTTLTLAATLSVAPAPANTAGPSLHQSAAQARLNRLVATAEPTLRQQAVDRALAHGLAAFRDSVHKEMNTVRRNRDVFAARTGAHSASRGVLIR